MYSQNQNVYLIHMARSNSVEASVRNYEIILFKGRKKVRCTVYLKLRIATLYFKYIYPLLVYYIKICRTYRLIYLITIDISMFFVCKGATYVKHMQSVLIVAKGKLECGQLLSH